MNQRNKSRLVGAVMLALAVATGWQTFHFQSELKKQQDCLTAYAHQNATISKARSEAAVMESSANAAALNSIFTLKTAKDYYNARDAYFKARKQIIATRTKNPVPEFSEEACAQGK